VVCEYSKPLSTKVMGKRSERTFLSKCLDQTLHVWKGPAGGEGEEDIKPSSSSSFFSSTPNLTASNYSTKKCGDTPDVLSGFRGQKLDAGRLPYRARGVLGYSDTTISSDNIVVTYVVFLQLLLRLY
jgi:hypothetical protein